VKVYQLTFAVEVPDDFRVDEANPINDWVDRYILNAEGLCAYKPGEGCSVGHWASGNVMTEQEFDAQFEDN
jgi:hypothetical protein